MSKLQKINNVHVPKNSKNTLELITKFKTEKHLVEILFGKLLGDGNLHRSGALRFCHSGKQREYIEHCYELFKNYTRSPIKQKIRQRLGTGNMNEELSFSTRSIFQEYLNLLYKYDTNTNKRIKILPTNLANYLTTRSLAYWIMDDGMKSHNQLSLCTQSFTKKENLFLINILTTKFNLECKLLEQRATKHPGKVWYYIKIYNINHLWSLVKDYILPSMYYKFGKHAIIDNNLSSFQS